MEYHDGNPRGSIGVSIEPYGALIAGAEIADEAGALVHIGPT